MATTHRHKTPDIRASRRDQVVTCSCGKAFRAILYTCPCGVCGAYPGQGWTYDAQADAFVPPGVDVQAPVEP